MSIGHLKFVGETQTDPDTGEATEPGRLQGILALLTFKVKIRLVPVRKFSDASPGYTVEANKVGHWADVGVAWENTIGKGASSGLPMYSIEFTEPELLRHLDLGIAAFPDRHEDGVYLLQRNEPEDEGDAQAGQQGRAA